MKNPKTVKYFVTTYLSDGIISNRVEVSKTQFDKQYKEVLRQYSQQEKDSEFEVQMDTYVNEYDTYYSRTVSFSYSICALDFTILTCKENYHFTK